jgi:hypothetical protein
MNFAHGMSDRDPRVFWLVALISAALGFGIKSWVLARSDSKSDPPK